jgi:hypothetical protein
MTWSLYWSRSRHAQCWQHLSVLSSCPRTWQTRCDASSTTTLSRSSSASTSSPTTTSIASPSSSQVHSCVLDFMALPCTRGIMCGYPDNDNSDHHHGVPSRLNKGCNLQQPPLSTTTTSAHRAINLHEHLLDFLYNPSHPRCDTVHDALAPTAGRGMRVGPFVSTFGFSPF